MDVMQLTILDYNSEYQPWFEKLNRDWIEKYFWMEPIDFQVLQHPEEHILSKGGSILMIMCDREIAGTVALKYVSPGIYEFTKMAVAEKFRGQKIGHALAIAAIEKARSLGAYKIILYSSTKLPPAIALYKKLGFVEVPVDGPYKRSDIKMELQLVYTFRQATSADAEMLCRVGIETFHDAFAAVNTPENMDLYLKTTFTVEKLEKEINEPGSVFLIAYDKNSVAGYVKIRTGHDPVELKGVHALEVERLYATKAYIGKMVGKLLMDAAIAYALEYNHPVIWLGVWEHNTRAIRFYEKSGFEKFGSHIFLLGTDAQTDLLMKKNLN